MAFIKMTFWEGVCNALLQGKQIKIEGVAQTIDYVKLYLNSNQIQYFYTENGTQESVIAMTKDYYDMDLDNISISSVLPTPDNVKPSKGRAKGQKKKR